MKLKDSHSSIIRHLRDDARKSFSTIGRHTSIPVTTVFDNYVRLVDNGVIKKHTSIVDFRRLGFFYRNFVFVKAKDGDALQDFLESSQFVNSVYRITGFDYLVDVVCPGMKEFYYFLDAISDAGVEHVETHEVIDQLRAESFLCDDKGSD